MLLLALLRPSLGGESLAVGQHLSTVPPNVKSLNLLFLLYADDSNGYLSFLDSPDVEKFGAALNAREVVNKLIAMGADCEKEEAAVRGQYVDEERIALKQYEELGGSEETYARLITDLLEAEERDVERVRAACVSQQREYLHSLVKEVLEYYSFLIDVDSAEAATFLKQADNYWETIRVGLDKCRQLYAKESDGLPPEVFSEEKMCRTEEVELLLEAFQSFVEQAVMMQGKGEGHSLEGYLPGILPVSPDKDAEGGEAAKTGSVESTDGPTDIEAYLPGILPVIPDNGQENKDVGKPIEETKEPTEETKEPTEKTKEPTEETKEPTEETKEPTEETKEPTEETKEPSEVSDELKDLEAYLPGILPVIPDWSGSGPMDDEKDQDPVEATEVSTQATETTEGPTEVPEGPTEATGGTGSPTDAKESDVVYEVFDSLNGERAGNSETKSPGASDSSELVLHNIWCDVCNRHGLYLGVL